MVEKEFVIWLRRECATDLFLKKKEGIDVYWYIIKDIDDWDGNPKRGYTDDEIYEYWLTNIKTNET